MLGPQFTRAYVNRAHKGHSEVSFEPAAQSKIAESKARQTIRIRELGSALAADGLVTLDEQAIALGLSRSTAWAVLKANHKSSGLAAGTINQMLSSPALPTPARVTILTYVDEKPASTATTKRNCADLQRGRCSPAMSSWLLSPGSSSGWFTSDVLLGTATASNASCRNSSIKLRAVNIAATRSHAARFTAGRFSFVP